MTRASAEPVFSQPERVVHQARGLLKQASLCALVAALSACRDAAPPEKANKPSAPKYSLELPTQGLPPPAPRDETFRRGVSLELAVGEVPEPQRAPYMGWLDQAAQLGATDLELIVQWSQIEPSALEMSPSAASTVDDEFLGWLMDRARARGLRLSVTPVIELEQAPTNGARRPIAPSDHARWFWSYHRFALHYARIAQAHGATTYAIGADLPETLARDDHWTKVVQDVRKAFKGQVTYVARAEHFEGLPIWEKLDVVSVVGVRDLFVNPASGTAAKQLGEAVRRFHAAHPKLPIQLSGLASTAWQAPAAQPERPKQVLDQARDVYQALHGVSPLAGIFAGVLRPDAAAASDPAALQFSSAAAHVFRYWYARSPAAKPN